MIPEAAVEAVVAKGRERKVWISRTYARSLLEAAAPHMADRRGAGDYLPGWDDRKNLASVWQEHAALPADGLSESVYDALIAVATWGYNQRRLESE